MKTSTHEPTHVSHDHLVKFYETLDAFRDNYYDGFVVTGAPVEHLPFDQVDYWDEFKSILDWASTHVFSTMYLCWGAMGALNYRYGVRKVDLPEKIFGVFPQYLQDEYCFLTNALPSGGCERGRRGGESRLASAHLGSAVRAWPDRHSRFLRSVRSRPLGVRQDDAPGGVRARHGEGDEQRPVPAQLLPA